MRAWLPIVGLAVAAAGCGDKPIGSKIPRPNKKAAAGIAAGIAGALTIANPKLAGRKPESDENKNNRPTRVKESVPEGVLDRADAKHDGTKTDPCAKREKTGDAKASKLELVPRPKPNAGGIRTKPPCEPAPPAKAKKPKPSQHQ